MISSHRTLSVTANKQIPPKFQTIPLPVQRHCHFHHAKPSSVFIQHILNVSSSVTPFKHEELFIMSLEVVSKRFFHSAFLTRCFSSFKKPNLDENWGSESKYTQPVTVLSPSSSHGSLSSLEWTWLCQWRCECREVSGREASLQNIDCLSSPVHPGGSSAGLLTADDWTGLWFILLEIHIYCMLWILYDRMLKLYFSVETCTAPPLYFSLSALTNWTWWPDGFCKALLSEVTLYWLLLDLWRMYHLTFSGNRYLLPSFTAGCWYWMEKVR